MNTRFTQMFGALGVVALLLLPHPTTAENLKAGASMSEGLGVGEWGQGADAGFGMYVHGSYDLGFLLDGFSGRATAGYMLVEDNATDADETFVTTNAVMDFGMAYVTGGLGYYWGRYNAKVDLGVAGSNVTYQTRRSDAGVNVGVGISLPVFEETEMFVETTYHQMFDGGVNQIGDGMVLLNLGIMVDIADL